MSVGSASLLDRRPKRFFNHDTIATLFLLRQPTKHRKKLALLAFKRLGSTAPLSFEARAEAEAEALWRLSRLEQRSIAHLRVPLCCGFGFGQNCCCSGGRF